MSAVVSIGQDYAPARPASSAMSAGGQAISSWLQSIQSRNRACESLTGRQLDTEAALLELLERHHGARYEAEPVIPSAVHDAVAVVRVLPFDLPMPNVDVDPDGCVVLDWTMARRARLGISIGRSGRLALSWLLGSDSGYAAYGFNGGSIPDDVLHKLREVARYGAPVRPAG